MKLDSVTLEKLKMTYHLTNNNSETPYVWKGAFGHGYNGNFIYDLPKYECIYCGSGDHIFSAKPSPLLIVEDGKGKALQLDFPVRNPHTEIPSGRNPISQVPEAETAPLVALALFIFVVIYYFYWRKR